MSLLLAIRPVTEIPRRSFVLLAVVMWKAGAPYALLVSVANDQCVNLVTGTSVRFALVAASGNVVVALLRRAPPR